MKRIAVIGGSASGFMAAITIAELLKQQNKKVVITIYEQLDRVGKKILATGNGRCNLTNTKLSVSDYHSLDMKFVEEALKRFSPNDTIDFFRSIGLLCSIEEDGKVFPLSYQASAVLDLLRLKAEHLGITEYCSFEVTDIIKVKDEFKLIGANEKFCADIVIVATGGRAGQNLGSTGKGYELAKKFGHSVKKTFPAIVQVCSNEKTVKSLNGLKFFGAAAVLIGGKEKRSEYGEILFTEYGLSGPPVLQLSRIVSEHFAYENKQRTALALDFLPGMSKEELYNILSEKAEKEDWKTLENYLLGVLNKKISHALIKATGITPLSRKVETLLKDEIKGITNIIKRFIIPITGTKSWANAQATAGGLSLSEFNCETMESKKVKNFYAVGEILDVDGDCGGFNLQWAWVSGYICGCAVAKKVTGE